MTVLVLAEQASSALKGTSLSCVTAAQQLQCDIDVMLFGEVTESAIQQAQSLQGVKRVIHMAGSCFEHPLAEDIATCVKQWLVDNTYTHIMTANSSVGKDSMPRLAALLDAGQISDILTVVDSSTYKRPIYAGNAIATVKSLDDIQCITVRASAFDKVAAADAQAELVQTEYASSNATTQWLADALSDADRPELSDADIVISGGRGLKDQATFELLSSIADQLGAAMGASRAAVDAGLVPNELQVGQTGQVVAPNLYIAVGISGAIQHLAGMKDSKVIVAINSDPEAPIFQIADYGLVADLFTALPELKQHLARG